MNENPCPVLLPDDPALGKAKLPGSREKATETHAGLVFKVTNTPSPGPRFLLS